VIEKLKMDLNTRFDDFSSSRVSLPSSPEPTKKLILNLQHLPSGSNSFSSSNTPSDLISKMGILQIPPPIPPKPRNSIPSRSGYSRGLSEQTLDAIQPVSSNLTYFIQPEELHQLLSINQKVLILDVREAEKFCKGHIDMEKWKAQGGTVNLEPEFITDG
jgi:hypothetical protein